MVISIDLFVALLPSARRRGCIGWDLIMDIAFQVVRFTDLMITTAVRKRTSWRPIWTTQHTRKNDFAGWKLEMFFSFLLDKQCCCIVQNTCVQMYAGLHTQCALIPNLCVCSQIRQKTAGGEEKKTITLLLRRHGNTFQHYYPTHSSTQIASRQTDKTRTFRCAICAWCGVLKW